MTTNDHTTQMIEKYSKLVHVLALSRTNQPSDADDVYQEVFFRYIDKKPKFRDEQHEKAWFIRVTINVTKDMYKAASYSKRADETEVSPKDELSDSDFIAQIERKALFEERISQLHPQYRAMLLLHFDCGFKIKEIARMLGKSEDSVKSLMARGKRQYKELVMKGDDE